MDDEKKADNSINKDRECIRNIDNAISAQKQNFKNLDEMEENFLDLNKQISKCIGLLNSSIKGKNLDKKLGEIESINKQLYKRRIEKIREQRKEVKKTLAKLNEERENYQEKIKEEYKKMDGEENDK